jgi:hypothetical protein
LGVAKCDAQTSGVNNTGAPYETCTNSNVGSRGSIGSTAASAFAKNAFNQTLARLNKEVSGLTFTPTDELGYSSFCKLFTKEDFQNYEYFYDISCAPLSCSRCLSLTTRRSFYYNNGPGSPVAAAQGLGYLQEFISRFTQTPITTGSSTVNTTLDGSATFFPLHQSIYADASSCRSGTCSSGHSLHPRRHQAHSLRLLVRQASPARGPNRRRGSLHCFSANANVRRRHATAARTARQAGSARSSARYDRASCSRPVSNINLGQRCNARSCQCLSMCMNACSNRVQVPRPARAIAPRGPCTTIPSWRRA